MLFKYIKIKSLSFPSTLIAPGEAAGGLLRVWGLHSDQANKATEGEPVSKYKMKELKQQSGYKS